MRMKPTSFTTFHFEWSWYCDKIYPNLKEVSDTMERYYKSATKIYMPPYVPHEIEKKYRNNSLDIPFIINSFDNQNKNIKKFIFFGIGSAVLLTLHSIFLGIKFDYSLYKFFRLPIIFTIFKYGNEIAAFFLYLKNKKQLRN